MNKLVFLDIETAPTTRLVEQADYFKAELNRIVCVGVKVDGLSYSLQGDEKAILAKLAHIIENNRLVAHNGTTFDYPFLYKRYIINRMAPPYVLSIEQKPWDLDKRRLDTNDMWNKSTYNKSSLHNICFALGIPTPKTDITGADVAGLFEANQVDVVSIYCLKDVEATSRVFFAINNPTKPVDKSKTHFSIPVVAIDGDLEILFNSLKDAAKYVRHSHNTTQNSAQAAICRCLSGHSKKSFGYRWRYAEGV